MNSERKMRVAFICTEINELGGKNNHFKNLYHRLAKQGCEVSIIVCSKVESELTYFFLTSGVQREHLVCLDHRRKLLFFPLIWDLAQLMKRERYDLIHSFQIQTDIFVALASLFAKTPPLLSYYESQFIPDNISLFKKIFYRFMNFWVKDFFEKTVVVSHGLKEELSEGKCRLPDRIEVVHLGFESPDGFFENSREFQRLSDGCPVVGSLGRLSVEKGLDRFVRAMPLVLAELPGVQFVIQGAGPEEKILKSLADKLGVADKIDFKGWTENVGRALNRFDIFVMPSLREGCPTALLEALALGLPTISSNIPGINEIITDQQNGILVNTADERAFAKAIVYFVKNFEIALKMGKRGALDVQQNFGSENEVNRIMNIYSKVLSKGTACNQTL